jgi:hypothetical protein
MKTSGLGENAALMFALCLAVATMLLFASISPAFGQGRSEDRNNPTPLKSKQVTDQLDGSEDEYFYQFSAGPGKLTVSFEIKASGTRAGAHLDLFDADGGPILSSVLEQGVDGGGRRVVKSAQLAQRQTLIMRIKGINNGSIGGRGTYQVLLDGAVNFAPATMADNKSTEPEVRPDDSTETTSFAGTWLTTANGNRFELRLQQRGNRVTGVYIPFNGRIEGTVSGQTLRFKWTQEGGVSGSGRFSMIKSDQSFTGSFRTDGSAKAVETAWNGTRPPASFAGVWNVVFDGKDLILILAQTAELSGDRIGGVLQTANGDAGNAVEDATIEGNILHFQLRTRTGLLSGLLVMDKDGKSLKGSIGTRKVTGTFVKSAPI